MPKTNHTQGTLPNAEAKPEEPLPDFQEVMEKYGPKDDDGKPTMELPDFDMPEYVEWLTEVDETVEQEVTERAPQIAAEALKAVTEELPPLDCSLDADVELDYEKYELSWNRRPTGEPIKVKSERLPTPHPRRIAK